MMIITVETYHVPVLLHESIDGLAIQPNGIYVDVTFGGGGHSNEILRRLGPEGHLFSFDQDADAEKNIVDDARFTFVRSNFRYLKNWMRYYKVDHIDGLLADLGVSSHHFDDEERGFSFRYDAPLDMRMNQRAGTTAAEILNNYSEEQLADILWRTEAGTKAGQDHRQSPYEEKHRDYRRLTDNSGSGDNRRKFSTVYCQCSIEERPRPTVSGFAHRGEPRNGSLERDADECTGTVGKGRTPQCDYLSFTGRSHRKEHDESRQCRGKS